MKITILILGFASTVWAAPMKTLYDYLPQRGRARQSSRLARWNKPFSPQVQSLQQPGPSTPISMEIVLPNRGQQTGGTFPSNGFIKYNLPTAPGQKSAEVFYPYDFRHQQQILPAMTNLPQLHQITNLFPTYGVQQGFYQDPSRLRQPVLL